MRFRNVIHSLLLVGATLLLLQYTAGCLKEEYSYEGGPVPDSVLIPDSTITPDITISVDTTLTFPVCSKCKQGTAIQTGQWNFMYDTAFLCGSVTNVVVTQDKTAFTFFGPSVCTVGTGLIITARYSQAINTDLDDISSYAVTMQYYDNNNVKDIFISGPGTTFSITINQFDSQTGIAVGQFGGTVLTAKGNLATIKKGHFKIQFP